jgi:hypothetical protein
MPAGVGVQESELLKLGVELSTPDNPTPLILITHDLRKSRWETGVAYSEEMVSMWRHSVGNIFHNFRRYQPTQELTGVWFDMISGLSDKMLDGIQGCLPHMAKGSLVFLTLTYHGVRNVPQDRQDKLAQLWKELGLTTDQCKASGLHMRGDRIDHTSLAIDKLAVTNQLLVETFQKAGFQPKAVFTPIKTYTRKQYFGVFGFELN